jgi:hypothetical protein
MLIMANCAEQGSVLAVCGCCASHCYVCMRLGTCYWLQQLPRVLGGVQRSTCQRPARCCRVTASQDQQHKAPKLLRGLQTCTTRRSDMIQAIDVLSRVAEVRDVIRNWCLQHRWTVCGPVGVMSGFYKR